MTGYTEAGGRPGGAALRERRPAAPGVRHRRTGHPDGVDPGRPGHRHRQRLRRTVRLSARAPSGDGDRRRPRPRAGSSATVAPALDEFISFDVSEPVDHLTLRQPDTVDGVRRISGVEMSSTMAIRSPSTSTTRSLVGDGQRIDIDPTDGREHASSCASPAPARASTLPPIGRAIGGVGFATVDFGLEPTTEVIRVPTDGVTALDRHRCPTPSVRVHPAPHRPDRPVAVRSGTGAGPRSSTCRARPTSTRPSPSAPTNGCDDAALAELLGEPVERNRPSHRCSDGARCGRRRRRPRRPRGSHRSVRPSDRRCTSRLDGTAGAITIAQPDGDVLPDHRGAHQRPGGIVRRRRTPAGPAVDGRLPAHDRARRRDDRDHRRRRTHDRSIGDSVRRSSCPRRSPRSPSTASSPACTPGGDHVDDCRTDLLSIDGEPVGLSFTARPRPILRGAPIDASGVRRRRIVRAAARRRHPRRCLDPGSTSGFHVDQVVLAEPDAGAPPDGRPLRRSTVDVDVTDSRTVEVSPCPTGCWVVLGEGLQHRLDGASIAVGIAR